jgi:hypothetical protein
MFQLYIDEDSADRNLVQALRARGVDVLTAQEAGMIERTDKEHAGMLLARQQHYSVGEQMRRVLKVMALKSAADMRNCVEFLSAWG